MHTIQLKLPFSAGIDGVDTSPNNPPSRAFSALLVSGKHHKAQTFCFLNIPDNSNPPNPQQWLGVFLHSSGDRILFFPGLNIPIDWVETVREGSKPDKRTFSLDHFSVEPTRQQWHITAPGSKQHLAGGRTPKAGNDSYYWMGLSFQSHRAFLPLYKQTYVTYEVPQSDAGRRMKLLMQLEKSTSYTQVNIENQELSKFAASFLHMCFIFSKPSAPTYVGTDLLLPVGSPYLDSPLPDSISDFKVWRNRVPLSTSWDIQITTMLLPSTISVPFTFMSPASL